MGRQRRGHRCTPECPNEHWIARSYGTTHNSIVNLPIRPRTAEQLRFYRGTPNLARPFTRLAGKVQSI